MQVVLVHGWLNTGGIMRGLAAGLTRDGHTCYLPSLRPIDGRGGLIPLAHQLGEFIDRELPAGGEFALIGFSMGVLVSRFYLQELGGHQRVKAFFSICGPHAGTVSGYLYPTQGTRDMRPGSPFLRRLAASTAVLAPVSITSYWTPFDLMIRPVRSAQWSLGQNVRIPSLFHSWMLFDHRVLEDIAGRLARVPDL